MRLLVCSSLALVAACASGGGQASLEVDGSWMRSFGVDRDTAYHAAMQVLLDEGYAVERANPLAGWFVAKSPVKSRRLLIVPARNSYTLAHVVVEQMAGEGTRIRLSLVRTFESADGGRQPNNDSPVDDRSVYEELFDRIAARLGS